MLKRSALFLSVALALAGCAAKTPAGNEKPVAAATPISVEASGSFQIDPVASVVRWSGKKVLVPSKHTGTIAIREGQLNLEKGLLKSGSFTLDMATINDEDLKGDSKTKLEGHLKSADFFDVGKFPTATLAIDDSTALSGNEYKMKGNLTIKGVKKPIEFKATATLVDGVLKSDSKLEIDRTQWGIKYGSGKFFEDLGDKVIDDTIEFEISLVANAK